MALIGIFLVTAKQQPPPGGPFENPVEWLAIPTIMVVSGCAAIGGLFLRPVHGALVGLILSVVLVPLALLGNRSV